MSTAEAIAAERERLASMVHSLIDQEPWNDHVWARAALSVASRAIRRGRLLTNAERQENLMRALAMDADENATP